MEAEPCGESKDKEDARLGVLMYVRGTAVVFIFKNNFVMLFILYQYYKMIVT
jgi:hypothetical protein